MPQVTFPRSIEDCDDDEFNDRPDILPSYSSPEGIRRDVAQLAAYERELRAIVDVPRFRKIVESMARRAEEGDVKAAKLLMDYVLPLCVEGPAQEQSAPTINVLSVDAATYAKMREDLRKAYVT